MNKIIVIVTLCALLIGSVYAGIQEHSKVVEINKQLKQRDDIIVKMKAEHERDNAIQADLQTLLSSINQLGINVNGNLQKILNKPVYNIICSDPDGVREVNRYAGKSPAAASVNR